MTTDTTHERHARETLRAALEGLAGAERCERRRRLYRAAEDHAVRSARRLGLASATLRARGVIVRAKASPPASAFGVMRAAVAARALADLEGMTPARIAEARAWAWRDGLAT